MAGARLRNHPGLHHQPCVRRIALPAGQEHQVAAARPKVDDNSFRPLHDPPDHHSHRQVRAKALPRLSLVFFSGIIGEYYLNRCNLNPDTAMHSSSSFPCRTVDFLLDSSLRKVHQDEGEKHK